MKKGIMIVIVLFVLVSFVGIEIAAGHLITGKLIAIDVSGEMYTIKTQSPQGFEGSRETIHVDPKTTKKTGDLKVGTIVEADVDINGHADWIKPLEETAAPEGE